MAEDNKSTFVVNYKHKYLLKCIVYKHPTGSNCDNENVVHSDKNVWNKQECMHTCLVYGHVVLIDKLYPVTFLSV